MAISRRETAMMVGGVLLGIAGAWALLGSDDEAPPAAETVAAVEPQPSEPAAQPAAQLAAKDSCSFDPVVPSSGKDDGELALESEPEARTEGEIRALLVTGKEAAAAGRARDAEVAFLMACRAAGQIAGGDGMPLADARYRLGRHYATTAEDAPAARRGEMLERARSLYTSSLQAYRAEHGEDHEKTRFAANGLDALQDQDRGGDEKAVTAEAAPTAKDKEKEQEKPAQPPARKAPVADAGEAEAQAAQAQQKASAARAVQAKAAAAKAAADRLAQTEAAAAAAAQAQAAQAKAAEAEAAQAKEAEAAQARAAEARAEAARAAEAEVAQAKAAEDRAQARAERRAASERRQEARREEAIIVAPPAASVGQATGDPGVALPE